jgi:hypothetical protein
MSTTLNNKARDVINSKRFRWYQALNSFRTSESETRAKHISSEDDKMMGKATGQGLFYTDRQCFENSSAT